MKSRKQYTNKKFKRCTEIIKKNQTEILELKITMNLMKTAIENVNSRLDQKEEKLSEIEHRNFEIIQSEENKRKKF